MINAYTYNKRAYNKGQTALMVVLFFLFISLSIMFGFSGMALKEQLRAHLNTESAESYFLGEAGLEDVLYRIKNSIPYSSPETLALSSASLATVTVTDITGGEKEIVSHADVSSAVRKNRVHIRVGTIGIGFHYGVQVSDGGMTMNNNAVINGNIYSNGNIIGANGANVTGDAVVATGIDATPAVAWTTHNADRAFGDTSGTRDIAQSFMANETGVLPRVSVYLGKMDSPSGNITLHIVPDSGGGDPTPSDIANATIDASMIGNTAGWIDVAFATPPNVTNGTTYWIVLDTSTDSLTDYWNWRRDTSGGYAGNTAKYTSDWSSVVATWTDISSDLAFKVWIGSATTSIVDMTIGTSATGTAHANVFTNTKVHGSSCPNAYCIVASPSRVELPITEGIVNDWRDDAVAGGTITGDYTLVGGATASLGPKKITGNLIIDNNSTLTITGTLWVMGNVQLSNGCIIRLDAGYGGASGIILTDNLVDISNNCTFFGSGTPGSYVMLLSDKDSPATTVMNISNNSLGVIYYAPKGRLHFSNNAAAKEATAYGIDMDNNAVVTYESGLASAFFSSGPAGGWTIVSWQEIQ